MNIYLWKIIIGSVQDSLEKQFGRMGGKIAVEPSNEFYKRMAVSFKKLIEYFKLLL